MVKEFGHQMMVNGMKEILKIIKGKDFANGLQAMENHNQELGKKINSMEKESIYSWKV